MIIVKFNGGLGNQMFQYAFGEYLKSLSLEVKYDISEYKRKNIHSGFILDKVFDINLDFIDFRETIIQRALKRISYKYFYKNGKVIYKGIMNDKILLFNEIQYKKKEVLYDEIFLKLKNIDCYLEGTWMTEYFYRKISVNKKIFPFNKKKLEDVQESFGDTCCIHIRRGDYLLSGGHGVCSMEYYKNAIQYIRSFNEKVRFLIFTDDKEWVKDNFIFNDINFEIVGHKKKMTDFQELYLMSGCKYFVIANSTFSWWAAILGKGEVVVYPKKWFAKEIKYNYVRNCSNKYVEKFLLPEFWIGY